MKAHQKLKLRSTVADRGHGMKCRSADFQRGWPGWLGAFLDFRWPPDPRQEWSVLPIRQGWLTFQRPHLVLICSAPNRWANIFAPDSGRYDRYGYNVIEDRWAYGIEPPACQKIREGILKLHKRNRSDGGVF